MSCEEGVLDLLIESCKRGTFDIHTIHLPKLLLSVRNNDKEFSHIHTFNFGDYYLHVIYYPQGKAQLEGPHG